MALRVRPCRDLDEYRRALVPIWHYFGGEPTEEQAERYSSLLPVERLHAAFEGGEIVGGAGAIPFRMSVPGGDVPCAGATVVAVLPTHRRRGIMTALMEAQLADVAGRGEPTAALFASDETIYGRYGYGLASLKLEGEIPRTHAALAGGEPAGTPRLVSHEEALRVFPRLYERARRQRPGMMSRSREWWEERRLNDDPDRRHGAGKLERVLVELDGAPAGYALYRVKMEWEGSTAEPMGFVRVLEAVALSPDAVRAVWAYLLGLDWTGRFEVSLLPVDTPLQHLLARPRKARFRASDGLFVRLVDVGAALAARSFGQGRAVVEVSDTGLPANAGTWSVEEGRARRVARGADVRCDAAALASAYLGGFSFTELADAGRVQELRRGGLRRADAVFASARKPWTADFF